MPAPIDHQGLELNWEGANSYGCLFMSSYLSYRREYSESAGISGASRASTNELAAEELDLNEIKEHCM